jgi:diguanylate cyclase (GGDEF)-like protein/PAS domain S-box-containing protein
MSEDEVMQLLARLPAAAVAAVNDNGFIVPMPPAVPLGPQTVIRGHDSLLELVHPDDLRTVVDAWTATLATGSGDATVRPAGAADSVTMAVHFVDARPAYGVLLVLLDGDVQLLAEREGDLGSMRPRVTTVRKDHRAVFTQVDDAAELILGHPDLVGRANVELIHPDDAPRAIANWMDMLAVPGRSRRIRLRQQHRDGHWIWFEITNHNKLNDPAERCVVSEMVDISEEMAVHEFLRAQEHLLRRLTDSLPVGVVQVDGDGAVVHRNPQLTTIVGRAGAGTTAELFAGVGGEDAALLAETVEAAAQGQDRNVEVSVVHDSGLVKRCQLLVRPLDGQGLIICVDDVTEHARMRDQLRRRATYDQLTGCLNRASVLQEIEDALRTADAPDDGTAVVFVDLDGFKQVNDERGHAAGDKLLTDIAECLQHAVRGRDVIGRIGGDEFLALSCGVSTPDQARALADRIADALAERFAGVATRTAIASLGVAWVPGGSEVGADHLIGAADAAMYESKSEGHGRPVLADSVPVALEHPLAS